MKIRNPFLIFLIFLIFLYVIFSFSEWISHYFFMHLNGIIKPIYDYFYGDKEAGHITHHKDVLLNQSLKDNFREEGLVFNLLEEEVLILIIIILIFVSLGWYFIPIFKKTFSLTFILLVTLFICYLYTWLWNSIHSSYHGRYIKINQPLTNNPNIIIYSPIKFYIPDKSSGSYKYLYWYHTLHHLNKGESKGNYNIICPLFDLVFGTYKNKVDNRKYFSKHEPKTKQEIWLKERLVFDIRVINKNVIEYKDGKTGEWIKMPSDF